MATLFSGMEWQKRERFAPSSARARQYFFARFAQIRIVFAGFESA